MKSFNIHRDATRSKMVYTFYRYLLRRLPVSMPGCQRWVGNAERIVGAALLLGGVGLIQRF